MNERDWGMDDVFMLYEIPGVYDGWSAALLKDGRVVNRWTPEYDEWRFNQTEMFIAKLEQGEFDD